MLLGYNTAKEVVKSRTNPTIQVTQNYFRKDVITTDK